MNGPRPDHDTVGSRITALRKERGLTQKQFALQTGVSRSAVAQWETNRARQAHANLLRIANVLGVALDALVSDAGALPQTDDELALLRLFRSLPYPQRSRLLHLTRNLADQCIS